MKIKKTNINGLFIYNRKIIFDRRGNFSKFFSKDWHINKVFNIKEVYCTLSKKNVLRGLHYQPISGSKKIVFCSKGSFLDLVVDLRKSSKTFGKIFTIVLHEKDNLAIHIPSGCAHANLSKKNFSEMIYLTSKTFETSRDKYFLWKSIKFNWPVKKPILSDLDKNAKPLKL